MAVVPGVSAKHQDIPFVKANSQLSATSSHLPLPVLPLFLLHWSSQQRHLRTSTNDVCICVPCGYFHCFGKNHHCGFSFPDNGAEEEPEAGLLSAAPVIPSIQVTVCGIWLGPLPPFSEMNTHAVSTHVITGYSEGSVSAFDYVQGSLGFLALGGIAVAFLVRSLSVAFDEDKFRLAGLPQLLDHLTPCPSQHQVNKAMEILSVLASSAKLLGCLFAPRCYIILFPRPDKNSL